MADHSRTNALSIAAILVCLLVAVVAPVRAQTVNVWLTTSDRTMLLQPQNPVTFAAGSSAALPTVSINAAQTYQTVEGFGASMTDSAAYLLHQKVPPAALPDVMQSLFDRTNGIGVSFLRNPMGASDLARSHYSYDDVAPGSTDPNLAGFSIAHDEADILPLLRQAKAINPSVKMLGSPWSPPGWMKSTGSMIGGSLMPSSYTAFANYLVKYLQAYEAAGVPVDYLTLQNEPLYVPGDYPGESMPAADQLAILKDYVLPALAANHARTRILVYDHNWDAPTYPETVLSDAGLAASPQIAGVAWHWYGGPPGAMTTLHNLHPDLGQYVTEASGGTWVADEVSTDFEAIVQSMRNWSKAFVKWGLALDENHGPHAGGCGNCNGLVTVNQGTGAVTKAIDYYTLGHFSKFVLPGAVRIASTNAPGVIGAAFLNPDRGAVLVAYNDSASSKTFQVLWNARSFAYTLPALTGATFQWSAAEAGGDCAVTGSGSRVKRAPPVRRTCPPPVVNAFHQIQASSYDDVSAFQTEQCTDTDGGFDLGFAQDGSWAEYRNVDFGAGASSVNVRVASAGTGGTVEFHLDTPAGPLIAQAIIPVTGGWQTWTTVTAPVSAAAGVRGLYVVVKHSGGTGGIGNLNWFQFLP
jgi:glucosylceramidase